MLACIRVAPWFAPAYDLLGKIYDSSPENQTRIATVFAEYLRNHPNDAMAEYHYGAILYARSQGEASDRYLSAKEHLERSLALDPSLAQAHVQLGVIAQAEGRDKDAVASFERAVKFAPTYAAARYRLGSAYQKLGERAKAESELQAFRALKEKEKEQENQTILRGLSTR